MNRREFHKIALSTTAASLLSAQNVWGASAAPASGAGPKFSVMLWTLPKKLSFQQQLQIVADAGYTGAEVGKEYEAWAPQEWQSNLDTLHTLGIQVDSAVPGRNALADVSKRNALTEDLKKAIPGAKQLGCTQFIYTAYNRVPEQTPDQQRAAIVDTLKYAADLLEKDGIELVLEPIHLAEHKEEAVISVVEAFEITRLVGSPRVKVLYDFYHEQIQAGNLIEKLTKNIDQVGLVHIADVPGRHEPGTGEVNYNNIYRELARLKYDCYICMEFMSTGDPTATLKKAREEALAAMRTA